MSTALLRPLSADLLQPVSGHAVEQLGRRVARLFRRASLLRKATQIIPNLSSTRKRRSRTQSEDEFLERLKRTIGQNADSTQTGRINIIGLDRLKERFGDRWVELRERAESIARSAIQKCLQPDDIWVSSGERFVIAFGSGGFEEAQTKCRMIARMIETALLGNASAESISVATATTFDGKIVFRHVPSLETMIANTGSFFEAARPLFREPTAPKATGAVAALTTTSPTAPETLEIVAGADEVSASGQIVWQPVWDTRSQRITVYRAHYVDDPAEARGEHLSEEDISQIDCAVRDAVIQQLQACAAGSRVVALELPVRFSTMASWARRREYLAGLGEKMFPPDLRKLLLIHLTEVPEGVPMTRLVELVAALRPYCRELMIEGSLHMTDFAALAAARVFAITANVDSKLTENLLMLKLEQFAQNATKSGIANCYLAGARSMPLVTAAVAAGFRYISGELIGATVADAPTSHPLTLEELYCNNLGLDSGSER